MTNFEWVIGLALLAILGWIGRDILADRREKRRENREDKTQRREYAREAIAALYKSKTLLLTIRCLYNQGYNIYEIENNNHHHSENLRKKYNNLINDVKQNGDDMRSTLAHLHFIFPEFSEDITRFFIIRERLLSWLIENADERNTLDRYEELKTVKYFNKKLWYLEPKLELLSIDKKKQQKCMKERYKQWQLNRSNEMIRIERNEASIAKNLHNYKCMHNTLIKLLRQYAS